MNCFFAIGKLTLITLILSFCFQNAFAQKPPDDKLSKLDRSIQSGLDSLKTRNWGEAIKSFEEAQKIYDKEKSASNLLFRLVDVPDEDNTVPPSSVEEQQISNYRHSMATRQSLLEFLSFAHQLNGDSVQAKKNLDAVYAMQGVMWGLSWRVFAPLFYELFNGFVKNETGENFGRYQYLGALLIIDSKGMSDEVFDQLESAQRNAPKDADVAGLLANGFLQRKNPKEAKRLAETSLSIKPNNISVLIDLATAEWLLGEFDNSIRHAEAVVKIDPKKPGGHLTLALNYIEKKDFERTLKNAATAVQLSGRHFYYLTVQAAAFEVSGNSKDAEKTLSEAWNRELPTFDDLDMWYIKESLRDIILKISKRLEKSKADA